MSVVDGRVSPYDVATAAGLYSQIAGFLAGFAVAVILLYVEQRRRHGAENHHVNIASALFSALTALTICAVMYASLAGNSAASPGRGLFGLAFCGLPFGLAVLTLFYGLTLLTLGPRELVGAALIGRIAVLWIGPVLILRFIVPVVDAMSRLRRVDGGFVLAPGHGGPFWLGVALILLQAVVSPLAVFPALRHLSPARPLVAMWATLRARLARSPRLAGFGRALDRAATPPIGVFVVASVIGALSFVPTSVGDGYIPPQWVAYLTIVVSFVVLLLFSLVCGRYLNAAETA